MRTSKFQSKCPKCGNVDILTEEETKKKVHCQCCYNHYAYNKEPFFKGYQPTKLFNI